MSMTLDKYDEALEWLVEHPDRLMDAWNLDLYPDEPAMCLFIRVTPTGEMQSHPAGLCGCLTQVRCGYPAWNEDLTDQIRADESIPMDMPEFSVDFRAATLEDRREMLAFAPRWQRRLDIEIRGGAK